MIYLRYVSLLLLLISIITFFFGYFPKTTYKTHNSHDSHYFKKKTIDKVVLIVVDSLRPDMVYNKRPLWPSIHKFINESWAYQSIAELQPPSMSLAKIKCIITGAIISYVDIMFNTNSGSIAQDNLIDSLKKYRDFRINLYGDETWLNLFPTQFSHVHASLPFFVNDFYEVDRLITANIPSIVTGVKSWDFVVMHYLGLDHIGHSTGPWGSIVNGKLSEMDNATGSLLEGIINRKGSERHLVILTADHGMSDLGGHGGNAPEELNVPLVFFNKRFKHSPDMVLENLSQNDIAPSLALLLGVPIPVNNVGVIPFRLLTLIEGHKNQTEALYSNYHQLIDNLDSVPDSVQERFSLVNLSISRIEKQCNKSMTEPCLKELQKCHRDLIVIMTGVKEILKRQFIQHNVLMLEVAVIMSLTSLLISSCLFLRDNEFPVTVPGSVFLLAFLFLLSSALFLENFRICLFSAFKMSLIILVMILTAHSLTAVAETGRSLLILLTRENRISEIVVVLSLLVSMLSLSLPTFIKEEHQVWYCMSTSLMLLYVVKEIVQTVLVKNEPLQLRSTYVASIVLVVIDRTLRTINRTGERWSSVLLFGDWLIKSENSLYLIIATAICLSISGLLQLYDKSLLLSLLVTCMMLLNGLHRYTDIIKSGRVSDMSVWLYYFLLMVVITMSLCYRWLPSVGNPLKLSNVILLLCLLICRHQNVILWTGIALKTILVRKIWSQELQRYSIGVQFIIFNILGMTSFFQQGNSNSLTTIDVQPGFVGMDRYVPAIVAPLVVIQLFSGRLYWIIIWIEWLAENRLPSSIAQYKSIPIVDIIEPSSPVIISSHVTPDYSITSPPPQYHIFHDLVLLCTIVSCLLSLDLFFFAVLHRQHITAWTIYAPKIVYHCFHYGLTLILFVFIAKMKFL